MSQEDLAERIGVSRQTIYNWESDLVKPNNENVKTLCEVLSVDIDYFYGTQNKSEYAITKDINIKKERNKDLKLVVSFIIVSIIFLVIVFLLIWSGCVIFTTNTGDNVTRSFKNSLPIFILLVVTSIILLVLLIFLFVKLIHTNNRK